MESPSNLRSLSQTLALKKATDAAEVASVTNHELQKLGNDLQRQSSVALTTTALAITQSAAKEMQSAGQQLTPQIDQIRQEISKRLDQMQQQIVPAVTQMQSDVSEKLAKMQEQIDAQLQPLDEKALKQRMGKLQGQINQQTKPLAEALAKVKRDSEALSLMTARSWLKPVLIGLTILASISVPVWGLTQYLAWQVRSNLATIKAQEKLLAQQQEKFAATLDKIESKTWGIQFQEDKNGRFLIFPPGVEPSTGWKVGNRSAVKFGKN